MGGTDGNLFAIDSVIQERILLEFEPSERTAELGRVVHVKRPAADKIVMRRFRHGDPARQLASHSPSGSPSGERRP